MRTQALSAATRFPAIYLTFNASVVRHCLFRYECGCDWRISRSYDEGCAERAVYAPRAGDVDAVTAPGRTRQQEWEREGLIYIDAASLLPVGKQVWTDQKKLFDMLRVGALSDEIEAKVAEIQHQVTIKLRRKRG